MRVPAWARIKLEDITSRMPDFKAPSTSFRHAFTASQTGIRRTQSLIDVEESDLEEEGKNSIEIGATRDKTRRRRSLNDGKGVTVTFHDERRNGI